MKLDAHVHTFFSGRTTLSPLQRILKESYNSPMGVYRRAKSQGMDLVAITDHDTIEGALTIAHLPDVIIGCEVTAVFPSDKVSVHLGVLGLNEAQHREVEALRHDVRELLPYLRSQDLFVSLNHVASRTAGEISAVHIAALMPWVDALEVRNGTRLTIQNRAAIAIAESFGKTHMGGSDSHTYRGIGGTFVEAVASSREEFMAELRAGRANAGGNEGGFFTMASDIVRITARFYQDGWIELRRNPLAWRRHLMVVCSTIGLPLTSLAFVAAAVHFVLEERFTRTLLFDLVAQPGRVTSNAGLVTIAD